MVTTNQNIKKRKESNHNAKDIINKGRKKNQRMTKATREHSAKWH